MSAEARIEAIDVVGDALADTERGVYPGDEFARRHARAEEIVDKLLETHAISRRAPRLHRAAKPGRPSLEALDL